MTNYIMVFDAQNAIPQYCLYDKLVIKEVTIVLVNYYKINYSAKNQEFHRTYQASHISHNLLKMLTKGNFLLMH